MIRPATGAPRLDVADPGGSRGPRRGARRRRGPCRASPRRGSWRGSPGSARASGSRSSRAPRRTPAIPSAIASTTSSVRVALLPAVAQRPCASRRAQRHRGRRPAPSDELDPRAVDDARRCRARAWRSRPWSRAPPAPRTGRAPRAPSPSRGCRSARRRGRAAGRWRARARSRRAAAVRRRAPRAACPPGRRRPTRVEQLERARAPLARRPASSQKSIGSITFSATVSVGSSWKNWNTMPDVAPAPARERVLRGRVDRGAADRDARPSLGPVDPADQVEQRRLAAARLAPTATNSPRADLEVDAAERREVAGRRRRSSCSTFRSEISAGIARLLG